MPARRGDYRGPLARTQPPPVQTSEVPKDDEPGRLLPTIRSFGGGSGHSLSPPSGLRSQARAAYASAEEGASAEWRIFLDNELLSSELRACELRGIRLMRTSADRGKTPRRADYETRLRYGSGRNNSGRYIGCRYHRKWHEFSDRTLFDWPSILVFPIAITAGGVGSNKSNDAIGRMRKDRMPSYRHIWTKPGNC